MKKNYFIVICIVILLVLFSMMFRLGYALKLQSKKYSINNNKLNISEHINYNNNYKYKLFNTIINDREVIKPLFSNKNLDLYVDGFLLNNKCKEFNFGINYLKNDLVSIKLECGDIKDSKLYSFERDDFIEFKDLIKDEIGFKESVYNLLHLKYPKFVCDEVDIINSNYFINGNELLMSYETVNYGIINLIINNNEIKNLLDYNMKYDKDYENEKYVLDPNKKTIAFTFDDGPSEYDLEIVDILKDSHASATFFIVGSRIDNFQRSIFKMIDNNMEIGNHSYDHKSLKKINNQDIKFQIIETNNIYKRLTGKDIVLIRPPYGAYDSRTFEMLDNPVILWNVDTLDWSVRDSKKVYDNILRDVEDGSIVLMHSLFETTRDAVRMVLPELYKNGYQVVSVSELARIKGINIEKDNVYLSFKNRS